MPFVKIMHARQVEFIIHPTGGYSILPYSSWFLDWIGWKSYQKPGIAVKIAVSAFGIQTSDSFIPTATIHEVAVRNDMDEAVSVHSWLRKKLHPIAYRIDVECGEICYIISTGLTEEDANMICTDIYKILSDTTMVHSEAVSSKTAS